MNGYHLSIMIRKNQYFIHHLGHTKKTVSGFEMFLSCENLNWKQCGVLVSYHFSVCIPLIWKTNNHNCKTLEIRSASFSENKFLICWSSSSRNSADSLRRWDGNSPKDLFNVLLNSCYFNYTGFDSSVLDHFLGRACFQTMTHLYSLLN